MHVRHRTSEGLAHVAGGQESIKRISNAVTEYCIGFNSRTIGSWQHLDRTIRECWHRSSSKIDIMRNSNYDATDVDDMCKPSSFPGRCVQRLATPRGTAIRTKPNATLTTNFFACVLAHRKGHSLKVNATKYAPILQGRAPIRPTCDHHSA